MAVIKQKLLRKNTSGTYDQIYLQTSSETVLRPSGRTVEQDLAAYLPDTKITADSLPKSLL